MMVALLPAGGQKALNRLLSTFQIKAQYISLCHPGLVPGTMTYPPEGSWIADPRIKPGAGSVRNDKRELEEFQGN